MVPRPVFTNLTKAMACLLLLHMSMQLLLRQAVSEVLLFMGAIALLEEAYRTMVVLDLLNHLKHHKLWEPELSVVPMMHSTAVRHTKVKPKVTTMPNNLVNQAQRMI